MQSPTPTSSSVPTPTRRALFGGGQQFRQPGVTTRPVAPAAPAGPPASFGDYELFLAHHATPGFSLTELARLRTMGGEAWLAEQLQPASIDDSAADALLAALPSIAMSGPQLFATYNGVQNGDAVVARELRIAVVQRAVHSKRHLLERLVEFFADLLNVPQQNGPLNFLRTLYDRELRTHALGRFEDLLLASGKSAAMLEFLNGNENIVGAPNENYSREAMELHTLGAGVVYSETDVREAARAFTGWSFFTNAASFAQFRFRLAQHDTGQKMLPGLGLVIPAGGGVTDGELVLRALAQRAETAQRVSRRLLQWFVTYTPPQAAVDRVVAKWTATGGDLREVVGEVLSRTTVALCAPWSLPKLKRPFHFAIGAMRQIQPTDATNTQRGALAYLSTLGQTPFAWLPPDGYPDAEDAWGTSVLPRWEFAADLAQGAAQGLVLTNAQVFALYANVGRPNVAARFADLLAGGALSAADVADVQAYVDAQPNFNVQVLRDALGLTASAPSYQRY